MGARYSLDLRRKIVQACERDTASQREVAEFFIVSRSFVEVLLRQYRRHGGELLPPKPRPGRPSRLDQACREQVRQWLEQQPDLTLRELMDRLQASTGIAVSEPTMSRLVKKLGMRLEKRPYTPRSLTPRAYIWRAVGTGGTSPAVLSKGSSS